MNQRPPTLTNTDHQDMDRFLGHLLDDYKSDLVTKQQVTGALAQVIAAIDIGNYGEATNWFKQGREMIRGKQ